MGESRSKRRDRLQSLESALLGGARPEPQGPKASATQRAGVATSAGDPAVAAVLEAALRSSGRVERATHGFHTWPAGLNPDAARLLLGLGTGPVLDPFCGGGTVLVEALLAGRPALGLDVSSVACLVARARTTLTTEDERTAMRTRARAAAAAALAIAGPNATPPPGTQVPSFIQDAYDAHVAAELFAIRNAMGDSALLRAVFSAILVKVSHRVSDTVHRLEPRPRAPGTTATLFHAKAREYGRMLQALAEAVPPGVRAQVHREDARGFRSRGLKVGSGADTEATRVPFGLVLTSPPYPGVYDYLPMQALRRWWLDLDDDAALEDEIGTRRSFRHDRGAALTRWREDTMRWTRAAARALGPGGRLVILVGDGDIHGGHVDAWPTTDAAAREAGLTLDARVTVERWDEGLRVFRPEHAAVWTKAASN